MSAQTSQTETAKQWFVNFLTYFRKEYDAISLEEKSFVPADLNYLPPCQIELVWLTQPEYQFIVKSNFADRPDMEVKIHGPYSHDEFIDRVDELVNSPAWNKPIGHGPYGSNNFSDVLASFLNTFMNTVRGSLFRPIAAAHQSIGMYGGDSVWVSFFSGNRTIGDYVASANSTITELKKRNGAPKPSSSVSSTTTAATPDGFVTFFYPPLRLGQRPKFTPSAILRGAIFDLSEHEKAFDASFRGRDIVVNKTGRVFVAERNKEQALRILNLIMAVGTLRGIDLYAVREHELGEAQYNKEKKEVGGHSYALSSIRMMQSSLPGRSPYFGTEIDPKRLQEAIMEAEKLYPNLKAVEELRLFIESFTHFNDSEYAQSFVLSWSIIERHLYELWTKKLAEMDLDEDRQSKLLNTVQWSTDYLIEVLSLSADISDLEYEAYGELKKKRNRFIHS